METDLTIHPQGTQKNREALYILLGGILGLIVAMGIGRFAFTPILALMQRDIGISNSVAGWIAGLNYLGYLAGALLCSFAPHLIHSRPIAIFALILSIVTTTAMGLSSSVIWWGGLRLISGLASAMLFIIISAEVSEALVRRGFGHWVGALYGGVGTGIALSGLVIPWLDQMGRWNGAWIGMGVISAVIAVIGVSFTRGQIASSKPTTVQAHQPTSIWPLWPLTIAYFFEGLGYIVTATFIVAIVAATPGLEMYASYSWVIVGLAAVPSTVLWSFLSRRIGNKKALIAAYALQAVGICVSVHADTINEVMFAAISFGGTFMGIVTLTMAEGHSRMKLDGKRAAAILTASFGVGQIIGPVLAGFLADSQEGFSLPLLLASLFVLTGGIFTLIDSHFISPKQQKGAASCRT